METISKYAMTYHIYVDPILI